MTTQPECGCSPWIRLSHCGIGVHDSAGKLVTVRCPSMFCSVMVPLVDQKIAAHDGMVPGVCPFIGTRVIDDTADFHPERVTKIPTNPEV